MNKCGQVGSIIWDTDDLSLGTNWGHSWLKQQLIDFCADKGVLGTGLSLICHIAKIADIHD